MKIQKDREIPKRKISFPFLLYFKQLFAANIYVKFINPFDFWRRYRINHLEKCREINTIQDLENCYKVELQSKKLQNNEFFFPKNVYEIDLSKNKILVSQASVKLKYRGVAYYTSRIVVFNVNQVVGKSDLSSFGSSERELCILERLDRS